MKMLIRFLENIYDDRILIWKKNYVYNIIYEDASDYYLETEIAGTTYALNKNNMDAVAMEYPCGYNISVICSHCKNWNSTKCKLVN